MKNLFLGLAACFAVVVAFAFVPAKSNAVVDQAFQWDPSAPNPFDPQAYDAVSLTVEQANMICPSSGKVCVIFVPASDVYTTGPNAGKPKVDIQTSATGELSDDIASALANGIDPTVLHGRTIVEFN